MKTKRTYDESLAKNIGIALRLIRNFKGESPDAIAHILGYKYPSSYCKVERGEVHEVNFELLVKICQHFKINLISLIYLVEHLNKVNEIHLIPFALPVMDYINEEEKQMMHHIMQSLHQASHQSL